MGDRRSGLDRRAPALGGRRATDHGTRAAYQWRGCRCHVCVEAEAEYHRRYAKGLIPGWVDASAARARLERLKELGVGARRVAKLCGLSVQTVRAIRDGARRRIHPRTAAAIMGTRASVAGGTLMSQADSYQTRERLRRLLEEEYPREWLRDLLGEHAVRAAEARRGHGEMGALVTARTWGRVKLLHERLLIDESAEGQNTAAVTVCRPNRDGAI